MAKKKKKSQAKNGLSQARKLEIAGILLMAVAILAALSIITYNGSDYTTAKMITAGDLFGGGETPARSIQNGLGLVGAYIAHFFVFILFGYISLIVPAIIAGYGWFVF